MKGKFDGIHQSDEDALIKKAVENSQHIITMCVARGSKKRRVI